MATKTRPETATVPEVEALRAEVAELRAMLAVLVDPEARKANDAKILRDKKSAANLEAGRRRGAEVARKHGPEPEAPRRKTREEAEAEYKAHGPRGLTITRPRGPFDR